MSEKDFDSKYGIDSSQPGFKKFHRQRGRMFIIKDDKLYISKDGLPYSHARWFELRGWMTKDNDEMMNTQTRGVVNSSGVYFYKGYDFIIDQEAEKTILKHLPEIVKKLKINPTIHLYGGLIKQDFKIKQWPTRKDYGPIRLLIK